MQWKLQKIAEMSKDTNKLVKIPCLLIGWLNISYDDNSPQIHQQNISSGIFGKHWQADY